MHWAACGPHDRFIHWRCSMDVLPSQGDLAVCRHGTRAAKAHRPHRPCRPAAPCRSECAPPLGCVRLFVCLCLRVHEFACTCVRGCLRCGHVHVRARTPACVRFQAQRVVSCVVLQARGLFVHRFCVKRHKRSRCLGVLFQSTSHGLHGGLSALAEFASLVGWSYCARPSTATLNSARLGTFESSMMLTFSSPPPPSRGLG